MEFDFLISKYYLKSTRRYYSRIKRQRKNLIFFSIILFIIIIAIIIYKVKKELNNLSNLSYEKLIILKENLSQKISKLDEVIKLKEKELRLLNKTFVKEVHNDNIIESSIKEQNDFCNNQSKDNNQYEEKLN